MLIVAGQLYVHPQERDRWVAAHDEITRIARSQPGCLDLHLSADPLEEGRINTCQGVAEVGHSVT